MAIQICWNCKKETEINASDYKCIFCNVHLVAEEETKIIQNQVIIPKELSKIIDTPAIKSMIDLSKPPLPWELEPTKVIKPEVPEHPPVLSPEPEIQDPPVLSPEPEIQDPPALSPEPEIQDPPVLSPEPETLTPPKNKPFIDIPAQKEPIETLDNHTFIFTPPENPMIHQESVFVPEEKNPVPPPLDDALIMKEILKEMEEKDRKLKEFIEGGKTNLPEPKIEEDALDWKKILKDEEEKKKKMSDFLEGKTNLPEPKIEEDVLDWKKILEKEEEEKKKMMDFLEDNTLKPTPKKKTPPPEPEIKLPKISNKNPDKAGKIPCGWLIKHTENMESVYYELFEGENVIGRAENQNPVDVEIQGDNYVSRGHATLKIFMVPPNIYIYELKDDGAKRVDRSPSLNGTYLNGNKNRIPSTESVYLQDGDTIQVGMTKLVIKIKKHTNLKPEEVVDEVFTKGYIQTIHFQ